MLQVTELPLDALNAELLCPVCLCLMREPVVTECMHRFCTECIEKSLRLGKKECPSCRAPVPTRRALRRDANMAGLIATLYPDREAYEDAQFEAMRSSNRESSRQLQKQRRDEWTRQLKRQREVDRAEAAAVRERAQSSSYARSSSYDDGDDGDPYAAAEAARGRGATRAPPRRAARGAARPEEAPTRQLFPRESEYGFILVKHPLEDRVAQLPKDYVTVSERAQVDRARTHAPREERAARSARLASVAGAPRANVPGVEAARRPARVAPLQPVDPQSAHGRARLARHARRGGRPVERRGQAVL